MCFKITNLLKINCKVTNFYECAGKKNSSSRKMGLVRLPVRFAGCAVCAVGFPVFFSLCGGRKTKFLPNYQNPFSSG